MLLSPGFKRRCISYLWQQTRGLPIIATGVALTSGQILSI